MINSSPAPGNPRRRSGPSVWIHFDPILAIATVLVGAFGTLMVYTATRDQLQAQGLSPQYYMKKQAIFMAIGIVVMLVVAAIDYRRYRDLAPVFYGGALFLLLAVYAVGHKSKGAQAWFQFGSYQLEPSELAKVALIIALAAYAANFKGRLPLRAFIVILVMAAIPFALIYKQPDLGTALVLGAVLIAVLVVGGGKGRHLLALLLIVVVAMFGVVHFGVLKQYQKDRLTSFVNSPDQPNTQLLATAAGANLYNIAESKLTISDGGVFGKGIGKGTQTNLSYVPEQRTDFIFTAVGEQVGLVGSGALLLLFVIMVWRTWRAATLARDLVGTLFCVGVLAMLVFQIFENVGMTMGIMPIAGIPLPLMSYGGSAIIATFAGIGLVLNVRMRRFA
ncbi:rod shape-determining protein RodA [Acidiferrimicrobium sp. IK]|uniref:rod shape-determining protein RodA n=1 Tax=Acidiferrimicrobium sp. IK TaxID=2871700 RepID=UPI0021CB71BA|nr:rod shape-determining protein RodA [Acidiferrimicrobium sp. IK]MCU4185499.1 rod shape-determining protein RodA [Acidiferrimicrobium sp. IK]